MEPPLLWGWTGLFGKGHVEKHDLLLLLTRQPHEDPFQNPWLSPPNVFPGSAARIIGHTVGKAMRHGRCKAFGGAKFGCIF